MTHPHADHTGGLSGVVYDYRPKQAYVGEGAGSAGSALRSVGAGIKKVRRGATLRFGALNAKVLSPGSLSGDANEDSVVLLVDAGGKRFLFTGDCTGANESLVGSICARGPPLYLLKVAHHGSRYSTSSSFLAETAPKFAVISVGDNSYGHPTPETISALKADGTRIYSTQKNGTITLTRRSVGRRLLGVRQVLEAGDTCSAHVERGWRQWQRLVKQQLGQRQWQGLHHGDGRVLPPRRLSLPLAQQDPDLPQGCEGPRLSALQRLRPAPVKCRSAGDRLRASDLAPSCSGCGRVVRQGRRWAASSCALPDSGRRDEPNRERRRWCGPLVRRECLEQRSAPEDDHPDRGRSSGPPGPSRAGG